jgi:8-oxo-dGTP pyrophosphatase MutT (NUDIX family)
VPPLSDNQQELFVVVDEHDAPVATRTRADCHADATLMHRSVFVLVETRFGPLYQRRGFGKDSGAGSWDIACAGHVAVGESYHDAAVRELAEELGVEHVAPTAVGKLVLALGSETEMAMVFRLDHDGPFVVRLPEVAGVAVFAAGETPQPLTEAARIVLEFAARTAASGSLSGS